MTISNLLCPVFAVDLVTWVDKKGARASLGDDNPLPLQQVRGDVRGTP